MNYFDYVSEMVEENELAEMEYMTEAVKAKVTYTFMNQIQPLIDKTMNAKKVDELISYIANFINANNAALFSPGPMKNFNFGAKDIEFVYSLAGGISQDEFKAMVNAVVIEAYGKKMNFAAISKAPHKLIIAAAMIWAIRNKNSDAAECLRLLGVLADYPMVFANYYRHGVREDIMAYTVEHLSSNLIKKKGSVFGLLVHHGETCYNNFLERLTGEVPDYIYFDYVNRIRNQINSSMRSIANAYYANHEKNATQHTKSDTLDDGNLAASEGLNTTISTIADNTYAKFNTSATDESVAKLMAQDRGVAADKLISYINKIMSTKNNQLFDLIESILILFFNSKPEDDSVGSAVFLAYGMALYRSIGTSKQPMESRINNILTYWMDDIIHIKEEYTRSDSIIRYRRCIFNYIVYMMKQYN